MKRLKFQGNLGRSHRTLSDSKLRNVSEFLIKHYYNIGYIDDLVCTPILYAILWIIYFSLKGYFGRKKENIQIIEGIYQNRH